MKMARQFTGFLFRPFISRKNRRPEMRDVADIHPKKQNPEKKKFSHIPVDRLQLLLYARM
jgi:hypothetical protein